MILASLLSRQRGCNLTGPPSRDLLTRLDVHKVALLSNSRLGQEMLDFYNFFKSTLEFSMVLLICSATHTKNAYQSSLTLEDS